MLVFILLAVTAGLVFWLKWRLQHKKLLEFFDIVPGPVTIPILSNAWKLMFSTEVPGSTWQMARKAVLPNYGKKALQSYSDFVDREANETVKRIRVRVGGKPFDVYDEIVMSTTYIVCQTLLGLTKEQTLNLPDLEGFVHDAHDIQLVIFKRMSTWYLQIEPIFWMTKYYQQQRDMNKKIKVMMHTIVQHRLNALDAMDHETKMQLLMSEDDSERNTELSVVDRMVLSNETMSYEEVLKHTFTIFTSSQEATAKITSYFLLMMAYHPEYQEKLYSEIQEVFGDEDREVTDVDLKQMPYLDQVFKEVVRLFPISVMIERSINEDITIRKETLPAGTSLVISVYHLHRDKRFWTNPDDFDPERFSPENDKLRNPNCYIPFGLGPIDCLGRYFAPKIVKTISVKLLRHFRLTSPETYNDMRLLLAVSAISLNGYPVQVHSR